MKKSMTYAFLPMAALVLAGCTASPAGKDYDKLTAEVVKSSFVERGIAKLDRLDQDQAMAVCSQADASGKPVDEKTANAIQAANMKTMKWPSDGKFLGDWKSGEKIAQSGRGLTWKDKPTQVNGGNCYNCHQIDKKEISFGNLGPSLYNYGKLRGVTDPNSPAAKTVVEYTWGKIWNSQAYSACSQMPRLGHNGVLTEKQVQDVMALLLDPTSPVNQ